jgi:RNA polymerase sigma factor (sigma-70 family)
MQRRDGVGRAGSRLARLDDERLAALVGRGDAAAFEALYDRHHAPLLAYCRHMVGDRHDGEDVLQQAFVRAHRALADGRAPERVRPWLFAIARNRCLTLLAERREAAIPIDDAEPSFDGLAGDVERRADLRELLTDLAQLPDDQRGALVLAELGDFSHPEIAQVIGCAPAKVKALVFQARTALIADRDARSTPCDEIRTLLETARGGVLRRGALRRHLRQCDPCAAYRVAMDDRHSGLQILLPVAPSAGLKAAVLGGAGGLGGGAESAAAAAALFSSGGVGASGSGLLGGGGLAVVGGVGAKALVAKAAVAVAIGAGATGGAVAVHEHSAGDPVRPAAVEQRAARLPAERTAGVAPTQPVSDGASADQGTRFLAAAPRDDFPVGPRRRMAARLLRAGVPPRRIAARLLRAGIPPHRIAARLLRAGVPPRRIAAQLLRAGIPPRRIAARLTSEGVPPRRIAALLRRAAGPEIVPRRVRQRIQRRLEEPEAKRQAGTGAVVGTDPVPARRRRRSPPPALPAPTATPTPTPDPAAATEPPRRRRKQPVVAPTPAPTAEPTPTATPEPEPEPAGASTPEASPAPATTSEPRRRRRPTDAGGS